MKLNKYKRYIAILVALAVVITTLAATNPIFLDKITKAMGELTSDEKRIIEDISNMTGVKTEEILKIKNEGKTWNEVLETIKRRGLGSSQSDKESRNNLLTQTGLGEDYIEKLKNEGHPVQEINEARMLAERVIFQLKEVTEETENLAAAPKVEITPTRENEDTALYTDLTTKFDLKTAVYLMLKLKGEFGSMEKVMDEYLYSLQIGINLETYLVDKKAYEKDKQEKGVAFDIQKVITLAKIETKMLEKIQKDNQLNKSKTGLEPTAGSETKETGPKVDTPKSPLPDVVDTRPKNPTEEVMKEINDIKSKSFNVEGR